MNQPFAFHVDGVLSSSECATAIREAEQRGFAEAPITIGPGRFAMRPDIRNNRRVMWDDEALAEMIFERLESALPASIGGFRLHGLNERFRVYRYTPGQRFYWHRDGAYQRSPDERSFLSLLLYLNEGFEGGATEFDDRAVTPRTGRALAFSHPLHHQGAEVHVGTKYVLRTDVMYRRDG